MSHGPKKLPKTEPMLQSTDTSLTIPMTALVLRDEMQVRVSGTNTTFVKQYADVLQSGQRLPAVTVAMNDPADVEQGYYLVDGWHRTMALKRLGVDRIEVEVVQGDATTLQWLAIVANSRHGIKLGREDHRNAFRTYVKAKQHRVGPGKKLKSVREMARDLVGHVSRFQIPSWMKQDFPATYKIMMGESLLDEDRSPNSGPSNKDVENQRAALAALEQFEARLIAVKDPDVKHTLVTKVTEVAAKVAVGGSITDALDRYNSF